MTIEDTREKLATPRSPAPVDDSGGVRRRRVGRIAGPTATYVGCVLVALIAIAPFLWMLSSSFKEPGDVISLTPHLLPNPWTFENYAYLVNNGVLPFIRFLGNSAYITVLVIIGRLMVCALGAYGFARLQFRGRDAAFGLLLASLMIPDMLMVLPLYSAYVKAGLINTHFPLIVPPIVANTFGTFLLRQFFMTIPKEYDEAALVDGASHFRIFVSIILPLSKPALATLAVLTFVNVWNDFFGPLVYLSDVNKFTVPVGLAFFQTQDSTQYGPLMAGATLAIIPTVLVFVFAQKYFTRGISMTGIK
ncbi:carbohydrate ABC transporter permease [Kribbella sp. NPDC051586]|uniref:carbohydrate ABC transporter permease n=1 Tax=Kribbella sp. NPDC051586 TaxID=3364118 RepID=UPI0037B39967